jgi:hypothetical protein
MGPEIIWSARYRGTIPNSGGEFSVEAEFMEYPANVLQLAEINEDKAVSFVHFDTKALRLYRIKIITYDIGRWKHLTHRYTALASIR